MSRNRWIKEIIHTLWVAAFCLFIIALVAGCKTTPTLAELSQNAQQCVADRMVENSLERDDGLVTLATTEQRTTCWLLVNEKLERIARGEERRAKEKSNCPAGYVEWCESRMGDRTCGCVSHYDTNRILRGY